MDLLTDHGHDLLILTPITYEEFRALPFADRFARSHAASRERKRWESTRAYKELRKLMRTGIFPCEICDERENVQIDHIQAIILGGSHALGNLRALCGPCHKNKKNY